MKNTTTNSYFDKIIENAKKYVEKLSDKKQLTLKEDLDHGTTQLYTMEQLMMYLKLYGDIHRKKLMRCYKHIPYKVWFESKLSIVDYGAGQGLAEIILADFMKTEKISRDMVSDITLIEPSRINLIQSLEYLSFIFENSKLIPIQKKDNQITLDDIQPKSDIVFHIFSNVIDLEKFQGDDIITLLNEDKEHYNFVICVSPFYQEDGRGKKIIDFCNKLQGYRCVYKFQRHLNDWTENYSCQIQIFVSSYF